MPSGNLEILHDFSAITKKVIITIAENSNPSAEVKPRVVLNAPHTAGEVTIFENLRLVLHRVKFYESTDGVTLETLLHSWTAQAKKTKTVVKAFFYSVDAGRTNVTEATGDQVWADPVSDETEVVDERLADASQVVLYSEGGSVRMPDVNFELLAGGGWKLINGETFSATEKWIAVAIWDVDVVEEGSTSSSSEDIHLVDADEDFDSTYYSKKNLADFAGTIGTTTFPALALIPTGTKARFSTYTGSQRYWKFQFASGETVRFNGDDVNVIYLRKNQHIEFFFKDGGCYVTDFNPNSVEPGQRKLVDRVGINQILLDGTQYNISDYPGLYADHISRLDPSQIITVTEWNADTAKQHYYAVDLVGGVFKVPDDRDMHYRALKTFAGVDGVPGKYQADTVKVAADVKGVKFTGTGTIAGPVDNVTTPGAQFNLTQWYEIDTGTETAVKAVRQYVAVYI